MEKILNELIENVKKDRAKLAMFKHFAVKSQNFALAAELRQMERSLFPESEELHKIQDEADKISNLFAMVEINASPKASYIISQALKVHGEKGGEFSLDDATKIKFDARNYFFGTD